MRKHLLKLTKRDFTIQAFKAGGKGGQHQNKTSSGIRIIHNASGARGESRSERSQKINRRLAFKRLSQSPKFRIWLNGVIIELETGKTIEERVDGWMKPENIQVEVVSNDGKWIEDAPYSA